MFACNDGAQMSGVHFSFPLEGVLLALPPNIGLGLRGLPGTNYLAFLPLHQLGRQKSFIRLAPVVNFKKLFSA